MTRLDPIDPDLIVRVAARGEGTTADGRFAALAAPGDRLLADGAVAPGPHHQTPPCRHFPECGGCQLQHLDDAAYATFLTDRVESALAEQGIKAPVVTPYLSPPRTRRRATLHVEPTGGRMRIGFAAERSHRLVDLAECHILHPDLFALVAPLRALAARIGLKRRADVRLTLADQGPDLWLGAPATGLAAAEAITAFARSNRLARFAADDGMGPEIRWEPEPVTVRLGGVPVPFPPGGFLQATVDGEAALVAAVREGVGAAATAADLFAGLGTFALALTLNMSTKVYAAEAARDTVLALKGAAARATRPVFAEHRDLYRRPLTPAELNRFAAIVIDPPRAGAREQATALAASTAPVIVYVSCNPSSFARDAAILVEGGYRLDWVRPVGQFRWSTHVELVGRFSR